MMRSRLPSCLVFFVAAATAACSSSSSDTTTGAGGASTAASTSSSTTTSGSGGAGPGAGSGGSTACMPMTRKFVTNSMQLPTTHSDYALDLNGDGKPDDQYGNLVQALSSQGIDFQGMIDAAITGGDALVLVEESSADATFANDATCAGARAVLAAPQPSPDFSGSGSFTPNAGAIPGVFTGTLASKTFVSSPPATATTPVTMDLPLVFASAVVRVPIVAAAIRFTSDPSDPTKLTGGQLNGAIKESDMQALVIPAIAGNLNARVMMDPTSQLSMMLLQIFDVGDSNGGNCTNPDGTSGVPNDGVIAPCEVAGNAIIQSVLAPDVQLFDAQGNYHPNPANTANDSFSLGLGFTAVKATF